MPRIFLEMAILTISLCIFPVQLNSTFRQSYRNVHPEPSFVFFGLNLMLSSLWVLLANITGQYFILVTQCNAVLCQVLIITMMYVMKKRKAQEEFNVACPESHLEPMPSPLTSFTAKRMQIYGSGESNKVYRFLPLHNECIFSMQ